jgi:hypothetical protein
MRTWPARAVGTVGLQVCVVAASYLKLVLVLPCADEAVPDAGTPRATARALERAVAFRRGRPDRCSGSLVPTTHPTLEAVRLIDR